MKTLLVLSLLALCACGGSSDSGPGPVPAIAPVPTNITCSVYQKEVTSKGKTVIKKPGYNIAATGMKLIEVLNISSFDGVLPGSNLLPNPYLVVCTSKIVIAMSGNYKFEATSSDLKPERQVIVNSKLYGNLDSNGKLTTAKAMTLGNVSIEVKMINNGSQVGDLSLLGSFETSSKPVTYSTPAIIDVSSYSN
jgi:hypothetical protein